MPRADGRRRWRVGLHCMAWEKLTAAQRDGRRTSYSSLSLPCFDFASAGYRKEPPAPRMSESRLAQNSGPELDNISREHCRTPPSTACTRHVWSHTFRTHPIFLLQLLQMRLAAQQRLSAGCAFSAGARPFQGYQLGQSISRWQQAGVQQLAQMTIEGQRSGGGGGDGEGGAGLHHTAACGAHPPPWTPRSAATLGCRSRGTCTPPRNCALTAAASKRQPHSVPLTLRASGPQQTRLSAPDRGNLVNHRQGCYHGSSLGESQSPGGPQSDALPADRLQVPVLSSNWFGLRSGCRNMRGAGAHSLVGAFQLAALPSLTE